MQVSTKWYDFLIAGGLFWLFQLLVIAPFGTSLFQRSEELKTFLRGFSDPVVTLLTTAVIALVTLIILITGAILDLMASGLPYWEIPIFHRHLVRNKTWVEKALQEYSQYVQEDYDNLMKIFKSDGSYADLGSKNLFVHIKHDLAVVRGRDTARTNALIAFNRLYMLAVVRAVSNSGNEPPELLIGPLQAWQLARLLASTLFFLGFEVLIVFLMVFVKTLAETNQGIGALLIAFLVVGIFYGVLELVTSFTTRGFDRVCLVLFSLWYNFEKSQDDLSQISVKPPTEKKQVTGKSKTR